MDPPGTAEGGFWWIGIGFIGLVFVVVVITWRVVCLRLHVTAIYRADSLDSAQDEGHRGLNRR